MSITIERAQPADLEAVRQLLQRSQLPLDGLDAAHLLLLVARRDGAILGCAGLELYSDAALLRSVAVDTTARGQGLGQRLTAAALDLARTYGVQRVYLLTETADGFFPRCGFRPIERDQVEAVIRTSVEWTHSCPASARVMLWQAAQPASRSD
ncbi:arsenic resistance N-acetyltransferase ArsN2 [Kallotenue papyrolyticum]|uniref:arsenic resistance N-acetyltransferase ArsN2 n=1 Tax=Kallotenue papyrolyticum TaxID=1325125 RepID=UPI00047856F2|nr:arsenic resistance N-acetyltransferase ArsN2 [Kallotenue papyrolyticum]